MHGHSIDTTYNSQRSIHDCINSSNEMNGKLLHLGSSSSAIFAKQAGYISSSDLSVLKNNPQKAFEAIKINNMLYNLSDYTPDNSYSTSEYLNTSSYDTRMQF